MFVGPFSLTLLFGGLLGFMVWSTACVLRAYPLPEYPDWRAVLQSAGRCAGGFFLLWAAHLYWIHHYATNIPFWDQWGAEGARLLRPYFSGELSWSALFAPHNEHRIFTHRVLTLGLVELNGQWDPRQQMVVNGMLHSWAWALLGEALFRALRGRGGAFVYLACLALPALPMGWSNATGGFQSQFYFLQFFGIAALLLLLSQRPGQAGWWTGWACLPLAYLSISGGALVAAALAPALLLRARLGELSWKQGGLSAFAAAVVFLLGFFLVPKLETHAHMKPDSLGRLIEAFVRNLSWPFYDRLRPMAELAWAAPLLASALGIAVVMALWKGPSAVENRPSRPFLIAFAFGAWAAVTMAGVAWSRGGLASYGYSWRYSDLYAFAALAAGLALAWIARGAVRPTPRAGVVVLGVVCLGTWAVGLAVHNREAWTVWLPRFERFGGEQIERVSQYVLTGDATLLSEAPHLRIPHPSVPFLRQQLDDPVLRALLPYTIREPLALERAEPDERRVFTTGGLPENVAALPGEVLRGNFDRSTGSMRRGRDRFRPVRAPDLPFLVIALSGDPKAEGIGLALERPGAPPEKIWRSGPGARWLERRFWVGASEFELVAENTRPDKWFGFNEPRELGVYAFASIWVSKRYRFFFWLGLALLAAAVIDRYGWSIFQDEDEKS